MDKKVLLSASDGKQGAYATALLVTEEELRARLAGHGTEVYDVVKNLPPFTTLLLEEGDGDNLNVEMWGFDEPKFDDYPASDNAGIRLTVDGKVVYNTRDSDFEDWSYDDSED